MILPCPVENEVHKIKMNFGLVSHMSVNLENLDLYHRINDLIWKEARRRVKTPKRRKRGRIVSLLVCFVFASCGPKCLSGHTEPAKCGGFYQYMLFGKVLLPVWRPEFDCEKFVCDNYEVRDLK